MGIFSTSRLSAGSSNGKTIISKGVRVVGELSQFDGPLLIDGVVEGKIYSEQDVIIGLSGTLIGEIKAQKVYVNGLVKGVISAKEIEILSEGEIHGDILCSDLIVEKGGKLFGNSSVIDESQTLLIEKES